MNDLDRDPTTQNDLFGFENHSHAAATVFAEQAIAADIRAGSNERDIDRKDQQRVRSTESQRTERVRWSGSAQLHLSFTSQHFSNECRRFLSKLGFEGSGAFLGHGHQQAA